MAVQRLLAETPAPVQLDAIGGASAGSITGLLAARTLLAGLDPVDVFCKAWVSGVSLDQLEADAGSASPLSVEATSRMAQELFKAPPGQQHAAAQQVPVAVHMSLAVLQGLRYRIPSVVSGRPPVEASTYRDWTRFVFKPTTPVDEYLEPKDVASATDVALASGANALAFPPKLLNRRRQSPVQDPRDYDDAGILNLPASGWLWYTDGGTIENEPLGQTLDLVNRIDGGVEPWSPPDPDEARLLVLVHPHPTAPSAGGTPWTTPDVQPGWSETLLRTFSVATGQSIFEDLRRLEKTNSRAKWTGEFTQVLGELVNELPEDVRGIWVERLREVAGLIQADKAAIREGAKLPAKSSQVSDDLGMVLRDLLSDVTGLAGKSTVAVDTISPLLVLKEVGASTVEEALAGEFMFHFGGFLDESLRQSDFDLGYLSTLRWLENGGLRARNGQGLTPAHEEMAIDAVRGAYHPHPVSDAPDRPRVVAHRRRQLARLAARFARVLVAERVLHRRRKVNVPS